MSPLTPQDHALLAQLADHSLPGADFNHAAHLRVGWACLQRDGIQRGSQTFAQLLQGYASALGAPEKYHATLTGLWLTLLAEAIQQQPALDWTALLHRHPAWQGAAHALFDYHYSPVCREQAAARARFLPPDRAPLPAVMSEVAAGLNLPLSSERV